MFQYEEKLMTIDNALKSCDADPHRLTKVHPARLPSRKEVITILKNIQWLMFPSFYYRDEIAGKNSDEIMFEVFHSLKRQISASFEMAGNSCHEDEADLAMEILQTIPSIQKMLLKDIQALYEGDPAAISEEEVVLSYPGFYAICIYRIAHELYLRKIPYLSRIMTEYAHEKTGIDIHAGATIGEYFFIDHGTGIVIGETTVIGRHVKLYQGVTLGAKSFELDADGNPVKGIKRHPNIGDHVIIYANATILGGLTTIGDHAVIGGSVWLTHSVEAGKTVTYTDGKEKI